MGNQQQTLSILLAIAAVAVLAAAAQAAIINVPGDQPTSQAGINAAVDGDEVVVADGTYTGTGNKNLDYHGKLITVRSANGPDNCIIDCEGAGRGFIFQTGETTVARVEGFTITNGFDGGFFGGGISTFAASPTIINCKLIGNISDSSGGGMANQFSSPTVTDCTFVDNTAAERGGGMYNFTSSPTITNCVFSGNIASSSTGDGGGIHSTFFSNLIVTNCIFTGNMAINGGAVHSTDTTDASFTNCVFSGNTATNGSGMHMTGSNVQTVVACTFAGNLASSSGGGIRRDGNNVILTLSNCILWGNADLSGTSELAQISGSGVGLTVNYTCIQGLTGNLGGTGNIGDNPFFVDPNGPDRIPGSGDEDVRLSPGSPCIDAADNSAVPKGITTDLDGNPRFVDDPDTPDTGNGDPPVVDMGAYEFQLPPPANNDPNNPQPINSGETISGDFANATSDGTAPCDPNSVDLFYQVTITTGPATLEVNTCGSAADTALAVFDSIMTELGCNTDCAGTPCAAPDTCLTLPGLPADSYLIRVSQQTIAAASGAASSFMLSVLVQTSPADITGPLGGVPDGCVDAFDLGAMLGAWCSAALDPDPPGDVDPPCEGCTSPNFALADISGPVDGVSDGCVDAFDLGKLLANWCSVAGGNACGTCFPPP